MTSKALFQLADGSAVESVLMRYPGTSRGKARNTVCVSSSSQVGCAVGCPFCADRPFGLKRHLKADEIVAQILHFARFIRETDGPEARITNVVFMGEGEPLANFARLARRRDPERSDAVGLGVRRVTISTSGLVPRIRELAKSRSTWGLRYPCTRLPTSCETAWCRLIANIPLPICWTRVAVMRPAPAAVSFEYAMMRGVNDSVEQAALLASLLEPFLSHVNLIPLNHVDGSPFEPTPRRQIDAFQDVLRRRGVSCTVRSTRGDDIDGACGQLKATFQAGQPGPTAAVATVPQRWTRAGCANLSS